MITTRLLRNTFLGLALMVTGGTAGAAIIQLGAALDASGSVSSSDFQLQLNGWANAVNSLPTDSSVEVTIVQFGTSASVEVSPTVIDSVATRTSVANAISSISKAGGGTATDLGINALVSALTGSANFLPGTNSSIINLATDGVPNSQTAAIAAAQAAEAAAIDALTGEAVGPGASTSSIAQLVFNPTCSVNSGCSVILTADSVPPNPLTGSAWVLPVTNFTAFGTAIGNKVGQIVGPPTPSVPEPNVIALLAMGLMGIGLAGRRARRTV